MTSKLYCGFFGHNYEITKNVTNHVKEYTCKNCGKQLTTNSNGQLVELTSKYKDINKTLERIFTHKIMRLKEKSSLSSI